MRVLFVVWELDPFLKVGGLGDVASSLPGALRELGVEIRIALPYYRALHLRMVRKYEVNKFHVTYDGRDEQVTILRVAHPITRVPVYLFKNNRYLNESKFPDTYAFFNKAIIEAIKKRKISFRPQIIHINDLHTGLIPLLIKNYGLEIKTILTIHNLSYQGETNEIILDKLGVSKAEALIQKTKKGNRQVNFLAEAIRQSDLINTVSPTYSREILKEKFGAGLDGILRLRKKDLYGILNGIDISFSTLLHAKYVKYPFVYNGILKHFYDWETGKRYNKRFIQHRMGLKVSGNIPLFAYIGRFDPEQKGIEVMYQMLNQGAIKKYQFIILGAGKEEWEEKYRLLCSFNPEMVSCHFVFDTGLAQQIYASSDFLLIPSKYEPCGLIQMIAMGYGTLPVAHRVGGLSDSIKDGVNGFLYTNYSAPNLRKARDRAVKIWSERKEEYKKMVEAAIRTNFSWKKSARDYIRLYEKLLASSSKDGESGQK